MYVTPKDLTTWQAEMSSDYRGPRTAVLLQVAVLVLVVVLVWGWFTTPDSGAQQVDRKPGVSLCEENPHWSVCQPEPAGGVR